MGFRTTSFILALKGNKVTAKWSCLDLVGVLYARVTSIGIKLQENAQKKRPVNSINCTKMPEKAAFTIMDYAVEAVAQPAVALAYLMFF